MSVFISCELIGSTDNLDEHIASILSPNGVTTQPNNIDIFATVKHFNLMKLLTNQHFEVQISFSNKILNVDLAFVAIYW